MRGRRIGRLGAKGHETREDGLALREAEGSEVQKTFPGLCAYDQTTKVQLGLASCVGSKRAVPILEDLATFGPIWRLASLTRFLSCFVSPHLAGAQ